MHSLSTFVRAALAAALTATLTATAAPLPALKVSENQRFLVTADGQPFFWLGATAWELFHRLKREGAVIYLRNRAERRFHVSPAVALAELNGLTAPKASGHPPLIANNPGWPNEDYFKHVDRIITQANALGLSIAFLPT
ncbi:MAG: DUF4038 domain-containing protein [Opitutaceae bacterium]|nr:DUF4038 domain-containing protein [Opitutaceae bacterium]